MKPDSGCTDLHRAWIESDIGDPATRRSTLDSRHQAHLGACVSCAALTHNEARAVALWRRETEQVSVSAPPPLARIVGAARERSRADAAWRRRLRGFWVLGPVLAVAALLLMVVSNPKTHSTGVAQGAEVVGVFGAVSVGRDGGWQTIDGETRLAAGDRLETGAAASLHLVRVGTAELQVSEKTELVLQAWSDDHISLRLERGELESSVEHRSARQVYRIFTPDAIVTVVGTRFVTRYDPDDGTTVSGIEGVVRVTDRRGRLLADVSAGQTHRTRQAPHTATGIEVVGPSPEPLAAHAAPADVTLIPDDTSPESEVEKPQAVVSTVRGEVLGIESPARPIDPIPLPRQAPLKPPSTPPSERGPTEIAAHATDVAVKPATRRATLRAQGDGYVLAGDYHRAAEVYAEAIESDGADPGGLVIDAGQSLIKGGNIAAAVSLWERYVERYPNGLVVSIAAGRLARHFAAGSSWSDAERYWRLVVEREVTSPHGSRALEELGTRLIRSGRSEEAAILFTRWVDAGGVSGEVSQFGLIQARVAQRQWDTVRGLAEQYLRRYPTSARRAEIEVIFARLPARDDSGR